MSRRLTERSIEHVVLERGSVANSWRTERWESLRLLTPNWQSRLPGVSYGFDDPDGFMTVPQLIAFIDHYAAAIKAPVYTGTTVDRVEANGTGYRVTTQGGVWDCAALVLASGPANIPNVPTLATEVPPSIDTVTPMTYRSPSDLRDRGVLIVGGSATGIQLADEIRRSGRPVTIAVGEQVRLPRTYRGRDIFWWLDAAGILDERYDQVDDLVRARHVPSPQLVGTPERRSIDLNSLAQVGVEIVGRLGSIRDGVALFSGGLLNSCRLADLKMNRLLGRFDEWAQHADHDVVEPPHRFEPTRVSPAPATEIDLRRGGIGTIVWATGYRPDYSWLALPVLDRKGRVRHTGGVVHEAPGAYLLGGNLLRTRRSSYIGGADRDTYELANHLHDYLGRQVAYRRVGTPVERRPRDPGVRGRTFGVGYPSRSRLV
jgi:putative flavoprotein involved in K+ transport